MAGAGWSTIESDPGVFTVRPAVRLAWCGGVLAAGPPPSQHAKVQVPFSVLHASWPCLLILLTRPPWSAVCGQALAHDFGVRGAQIEEIVTMDDSEFANLAPVYGLIFLFKWTQEMAQAHKTSSNCGSAHLLCCSIL